MGRSEVTAAIADLEASRSVFVSLGYQTQIAETTRFLGSAQLIQGNFETAEKYLEAAQLIYRTTGNLFGLATCAEQVGHLRHQQERQEEALVQFEFARRIFEKLKLQTEVQKCLY